MCVCVCILFHLVCFGYVSMLVMLKQNAIVLVFMNVKFVSGFIFAISTLLFQYLLFCIVFHVDRAGGR